MKGISIQRVKGEIKGILVCYPLSAIRCPISDAKDTKTERFD